MRSFSTARGNFEKFVKKRPSVFWWTLVHLLAIAFAVISWTTCLFLFNYPERPRNYDWLRKLGRLDPITDFPALQAPEGTSADPETLYPKYFPLQDSQLQALNTQLQRNYLTNFKKARLNTYVEGEYRVIASRPLTPNDFFHPGLVITAQAYVKPDEIEEPTPYPVFIDLLLPFARPPNAAVFEPSDYLSLEKIKHRAAILHVAKGQSSDEPAVHLTVIPLSYEHYRTPEQTSLALSPPDPLNLLAPLPATKLK